MFFFFFLIVFRTEGNLLRAFSTFAVLPAVVLSCSTPSGSPFFPTLTRVARSPASLQRPSPPSRGATDLIQVFLPRRVALPTIPILRFSVEDGRRFPVSSVSRIFLILSSNSSRLNILFYGCFFLSPVPKTRCFTELNKILSYPPTFLSRIFPSQFKPPPFGSFCRARVVDKIL